MSLKIRIGFKKLYIIFFILVFFSVISAILIPVQLQRQGRKINHIQNEVNPFVVKLNQLDLLLSNSKLLIISWIYLPDNQIEKKQLMILHDEDYPALKLKIKQSPNYLMSDSVALKNLFLQIDTVLNVQQEVMTDYLSRIEDYSNPIKMFTSNELLTTEIYPRTIEAQHILKEIISKNEKEAEVLRTSMIGSFRLIMTVAVLIGIGFVLIIVFVGIYIFKTVTKPVLEVRDILHVLSSGAQPEITLHSNEKVIQEMVSAVQVLARNFSATAYSATEIGKGNFNVKFSPLSDGDILGKALVLMRDSLKSYSEEMEQKVLDRTILLQKQNELLHEQKLVIEEKNNNIISSITYAQRIQTALLPLDYSIKTYFDEYFIIYKPKDIVSGDFYWFTEKNGKQFVVVADCTGHGVPGAFMSMLGITLLSQIIEVENFLSADEILMQLHKAVRVALKQVETENQDGMDIALCIIDWAERKMEYAGAHNPLYYFQQGELFEIKADHMAIGGYQQEQERVFTSNIIDISVPTTFYIFSDGIQDQFGGEKGRKLSKKGLKELLASVQDDSMANQKQLIESYLEKWMSLNQQIDDISILGMKLS